MGSPDGGWYDDMPPRIISTTPQDGGVSIRQKKIIINFDEYIKIDDPTNKVVVSPPQLEMPEIKAQGKRIVVELKDTLKDSLTYTIDFSDAITDNNEQNPMGNYTFTFSTGDHIDTLEVGGYVINAEDHEPIKGMLVGLYKNLADSAFTTEPILRVSRTDSRGHFVIKGVAPGDYRCYALQDVDGDYRFSQKSEAMAFSHEIISPTCGPDIRQDTMWMDSLHIASIIQTPYTHFYPDNFVLQAFTHVQTDRHLLKHERKDAEKFSIFFTYGSDTLPKMRGLNFDLDRSVVPEHSIKLDTLNFWLRDTALVNTDTLFLEMTFQATDTLGGLEWKTDTLPLLAKTPYEKRMKNLQKELEQWEKQQEKRKKRGQPYDSVMAEKPLDLRISLPGTPDPESVIRIESPTPIACFDTSKVHLSLKVDSIWVPEPLTIVKDSLSPRRYTITANWQLDCEYKFEIDTLAAEDIYGKTTLPLSKTVKTLQTEAFGTLQVTVSGLRDTTLTGRPVIVQMLDKGGKLHKQATAENNVAKFLYLKEGSYYLRAFVDVNGNGVWDTGDYAEDRQPEQVFYDPKPVECKAKWNIKRDWNLTATPLYSQKPAEITKQKAEKNKKKINRNLQRAKDLGIEYKPKAL